MINENVKHIPSCISYRMDELLFDLLDFAARKLTLRGRLVYWLPTTDQLLYFTL